MSLKAPAASVYFLFWFFCLFFRFNMLKPCQRQLFGFWHRHIHNKFSLFLSLHHLFTIPLSWCHSFSPPSIPLPSPCCLPEERCPGFSHDRSGPCRFDLRILPLFKVTDCCMLRFTPKLAPVYYWYFLLHKAHAFPTDQAPFCLYKLYQRQAGNKCDEKHLDELPQGTEGTQKPEAPVHFCVYSIIICIYKPLF